MSGIGTRQVATAVNLVTTAETAALTLPFASGCSANPSLANPISGSAAKNRINGVANITAGTAATSVQIRCRIGNNTITGTQVGPTLSYTIAAGASANVDFEFSDVPGLYAQAYTITVQQVAATGNGTVNDIRGYVSDWT